MPNCGNSSCSGKTARYLVAACEYRKRASGSEKSSLGEFAKQQRLQESLLVSWVSYLGRIEKQPSANRPAALRDASSGKLTGSDLQHSADQLQQALVALASRKETEAPEKQAAGSRAAAVLRSFGRTIRNS